MAKLRDRITTIWSGVTLTAGAADTTSGEFVASEVVSPGGEGLLYIKLVNGATGPTIAAQVQVQLSPDGGTTWYDYGGPLVGGTGGTGADDKEAHWAEVSLAMRGRLRLVAGSNTGQDVTVTAHLVEVL